MENCLLIIDEKRGRNLAEEMSLRIIGSLGVILKAKQKGVIPSAKEIIAKIEKTNFRISNSLKADLLRRVNEL